MDRECDVTWHDSVEALPIPGEYVEFLTLGTDVPTAGQFDRGKFCSRWADYEPSRVKAWRGLSDAARKMLELEWSPRQLRRDG